MKKNASKFTIIGAGKIAWSLIPAMQEAGFTVDCIISRKISDAERAAEKFGIRKFSDSVKDLPGKSIVLLAVPDDQLLKISKQIFDAGRHLDRRTFVHFSGVYSSDVLKYIKNNGGSTASFHIMQTFPSKRRVKIKNSYGSVESSDKKIRIMLIAFASKLGINAFEINGANKAAYHLSGVFASNFLVANFYSAEKLFRQAGGTGNFFDFIEPIIKRTISNIRNAGAKNSLSGPVERGDLNTVKVHTRYLKNDKLMLSAYLIQSLNIIQLKKEQGDILPAHKKIELFLNSVLRRAYLK